MKATNGVLEMSKDEQKAVNALRKVESSPAWDRAGAYIIIHPDGKRWGKLKVAYPADGMGPLHAFLWDCDGTGIQYGKASGCGYDKLSAALSGMTFDGIPLTDHPVNWEISLRKAGYQIVRAI